MGLIESAIGFLSELLNEGLRDGRDVGSLDDLTVTHRFAIESFVAGFVGLQGCAVQAEAGEGALGVAEKQNLCVRIPVGRLTVAPGDDEGFVDFSDSESENRTGMSRGETPPSSARA